MHPHPTLTTPPPPPVSFSWCPSCPPPPQHPLAFPSFSVSDPGLRYYPHYLPRFPSPNPLNSFQSQVQIEEKKMGTWAPTLWHPRCPACAQAPPSEHKLPPPEWGPGGAMESLSWQRACWKPLPSAPSQMPQKRRLPSLFPLRSAPLPFSLFPPQHSPHLLHFTSWPPQGTGGQNWRDRALRAEKRGGAGAGVLAESAGAAARGGLVSEEAVLAAAHRALSRCPSMVTPGAICIMRGSSPARRQDPAPE